MVVAVPIQPDRVFVSVTVTLVESVEPAAGLPNSIVAAFVLPPPVIVPLAPADQLYVLPTTFVVL